MLGLAGFIIRPPRPTFFHLDNTPAIDLQSGPLDTTAYVRHLRTVFFDKTHTTCPCRSKDGMPALDCWSQLASSVYCRGNSSGRPKRSRRHPQLRPIPPVIAPASSKSPTVASNDGQIQSGQVVTIDPNLLVLNAIRQSVWGPPLACKVYQRSVAYDQQVITSGEYKASGLGTGQFRYSATVSSGETTIDRIEVSDGRLMFTQLGQDEPPRRVNLDQVRQQVGNAIHQAGERPEVNFYLAVGGQPELLRNLYHRYFWYKAVTRQIHGVDVWQLVGRLRTDPPKLAGNTYLDGQNMAPVPAGSSYPTEVQLTLGRSATAPYFPFMVEYFRRTKRADGQPDSIERLSVLEHTELTTTVNIVDKDFVFKIPDSVDKIEDDTELYKPRAPLADRGSFPFR